MTRRLLLGTFMALSLTSLSGAALVLEEEPVDPVVPAAATLDAVETAMKLVVYGRDTQTPEALVTAALMLAKNPVEALPDVTGSPAEAAIKPADLLTEAAKMRPDDKALAGIIEKAGEELKVKERGSVNGPYTHTAALTGFTAKRTFKAKEPALVKVSAHTTKVVEIKGPFGKLIKNTVTIPVPVKVEILGPDGKPVYSASGPLVAWSKTITAAGLYTIKVTPLSVPPKSMLTVSTN